jgi:hypothetical protein
MGLWGAALAIAFGTGGFFGTVLVDLVKRVTGSSGGGSYAFVFAVEAFGFYVAQWVAQMTTFSTHDEQSIGVPLNAGAPGARSSTSKHLSGT